MGFETPNTPEVNKTKVLTERGDFSDLRVGLEILVGKTMHLVDKSDEFKTAEKIEFLEGDLEELNKLRQDKDFQDKLDRFSKIYNNLHITEKK